MFYFLAIVLKNDILDGDIIPSYTLCQSHGTAETRSGWRVAKRGSAMESMPKVLVTSPAGHEDMVHFLFHYRTRDREHKAHGVNYEKTMKYYPVGALFWFACNEYGERAGPAIYITDVPKEGFERDSGFKWLREKPKPSFVSLLTKDPTFLSLETSGVKPWFYNKLCRKKEIKHVGKTDEECF